MYGMCGCVVVMSGGGHGEKGKKDSDKKTQATVYVLVGRERESVSSMNWIRYDRRGRERQGYN